MLWMDYRKWPFDEGQRRALQDESRLMTITGGAGSGRTHVLLSRCLEWLLAGVPAEQMQVLVSSPQAAEQARWLLTRAGGCQVDTVPAFCARLVRLAHGTNFTVLSHQDAVGLLGSHMAGNREVLSQSRGSRWPRMKDRAARTLASGGNDSSGWKNYLAECVQRGLYDRWRIVERAAECLENNPRLTAELREGSCRWLLADDVHRWGRAERRLLNMLVVDNSSVTLAGDPAQQLHGDGDVMAWLKWVWQDEVSTHRLERNHRSSAAICEQLTQLSGWHIQGYRPRGEDPLRITGATPVESEAMAAETIAEWTSRGLDAGDVGVIDLLNGPGIRDMGVHLSRVGVRMGPGVLVDEEAGDAMDAAAMLRLALNPRDVVALARSWRRTDGGAHQVGRKAVNRVTVLSAGFDGSLLQTADTLLATNLLPKSQSSWLTDLAECQRGLGNALDRGRGAADVLRWRRNRIFGRRPASADFQYLATATTQAESAGQFRAGLAEMLDRRALIERKEVGPGEVEVLGVSEAGGREWRGVCVINAVRPKAAPADQGMHELYVACGRAKDLLAVCDYRVDNALQPVVPLLGME